MVNIVTLRPFRGDEGFVPPRTRLDVSEKRAQQLVNKKLATYDVGARTAPKNKMMPAAETPPLAQSTQPGSSDQAGGQTGAGSAASSSPQGRAPRRSRSRTAKAKQK